MDMDFVHSLRIQMSNHTFFVSCMDIRLLFHISLTPLKKQPLSIDVYIRVTKRLERSGAMEQTIKFDIYKCKKNK